MKSKLLTVILIFIISSLTAQSISEIKKNSTPIYGRMTGEYTPDREQFEKIKNILEEDILTKEEYKTEKKEAFRFITSILRKGKRPTFGLLSDIKSGSNALYKSLLKLFYFNKAKIKLKIYPYFFDKNNFKVSATCNLQSPVIVDVIC